VGTSQELTLARQYQQTGRLPAAEQLYRQIVLAEPTHAEAWYLLGIVTVQLGNHQEGAACLERALALHPDWPEAHNELGGALRTLGQLDGAVACFQRAVQLQPDFALAH
jgi:tetratricopeptide (TPR) repeat protein